MATVAGRGSYDVAVWPSREYPFQVQHVGKRVYKGRGIAGHSNWEGQAEQTGYITMTGDLQSVQFKVEGNHRPVRWVFVHADGNFAPNSSNYNLDIFYRETAVGASGAGGNPLTNWERIGGNVVSTPTYTEVFGERYERQTNEYRVTFQGTAGHILWLTPYMQYLDPDKWGNRQ
jgi:hypothetical protein